MAEKSEVNAKLESNISCIKYTLFCFNVVAWVSFFSYFSKTKKCCLTHGVALAIDNPSESTKLAAAVGKTEKHICLPLFYITTPFGAKLHSTGRRISAPTY